MRQGELSAQLEHGEFRTLSSVGVCLISAHPMTLELFQLELLDALKRAGAVPLVVAGAGAALDRIRLRGALCVAVSIPRSPRPWAALRALVRLVGVFRAHRPTIVHTHTPMAALLGQVAAKLARVPIRLNTVHGLYFVRGSHWASRMVYRFLELTACRLADQVISVSEQDARYMEAREGFAPSRLLTMHVGIDLARFSPRADQACVRAELREQLAIPTDAVVFCIVARMVREKGFLELFSAMASLAYRHRNAYLLHVGDVDRERDADLTPAMADRAGCGAVCRFVGLRHDVERYLAASDVFVLPSHREGYPVSVMEACGMGLPCIVTDIRGCREAVIAGHTGLLVPPRHPAALEQAMERLLLDGSLRQAMGQAARVRAEEQFDRKRVVTSTMAMYVRWLRQLRRRRGQTGPGAGDLP